MKRMHGMEKRDRGDTGRGRAPAAGAPGAPGRGRPTAGRTPRNPNRARSPRILLAGVLALAIYFAVLGGDYSVFESRQAEARLAARQAEIGAVRHEIDSIRARIDSLRLNDDALERFARERYGFIRDGEYLYRISEPEEDGQPGQPGTDPQERPWR